MSGGSLVVLDRGGREVKRYALPAGLATVGSDAACDIRVMQQAVRRHHATVAVHSAQTVLRSVGDGDTVLNDAPVSVAALRHGDVITVGDRRLRWEYYNPTGKRQPGAGGPGAATLARRGAGSGAGSGAGRGARRVTMAAAAARDRELQVLLELRHRASMPAGAGGKQVAVVQPQRRDTNAAEQTVTEQLSESTRRIREEREVAERASRARPAVPADTTTAATWIHARRNTPRRHKSLQGRGAPPRAARPAPRARPRSAPGKIQPPLTIDHTKRAAIMLMTGHAKSKPSPANSPSYLVKKRSPAAKRAGYNNGITPKRRGTYGNTSSTISRSIRKSSPSSTRNQSVTILEITDSSSRQSTISTRSSRSTFRSLAQPTPKKSSMKDFTKKTTRKTESIKFDLSNLDSQQQSVNEASITEDDITLHYSESSGSRSPSPRKSLRGTTLQGNSSSVQYANAESANSTLASAFRTRTLSPRKTMELYSIVDLVSLDSNDSADITKSGYDSTAASKSVYNSAGSANTTDFGTPPTSGRKTRSTIDPTLLGSSTPYVDKRPPALPSPSPGAARRAPAPAPAGCRTPENTTAPSPAATPVLNIRSFLDAAPGSGATSARRRPGGSRRRTGGAGSGSKTRPRNKRKSLSFLADEIVLRLSTDSSETSVRTEPGAPPPQPEDLITPKSAVKLVPEAVKNKHSTAKKPQSKRSIIDTLNRSDMVKQLFNSPVKRKLSQSMTEFSRKHSLDRERRLRHTVAVLDHSALLAEPSDSYSPERFVSSVDSPPRSSPRSPLRSSPRSPPRSPDFTGVKRLFHKSTPENDLRRVSGIQKMLRTPRTRKSVKNDLTNVSGVKAVFARSPRNRLSDVRVKEVFTAAPENDLRRVSGVKTLFRNKSPRNDLSDVRGVKRLFVDRSPNNDLTNVSGVKRTLRNTPKNDLTDVRGVRKTFKNQKQREQNSNMSGIEELFDSSSHSARDPELLFDRLVGKPIIKAVYSKSFINKKPKKNSRTNKSLHTSDVTANNVEQWLEKELQRCLHKDDSKVTKELQRLATDTVNGERPIILNKTRNSSMKKSASEIYAPLTLPIKKRSLVEPPCAMPATSALPIKKRAVLHSTPVKGPVDLTMTGSDLGRVSPITVLDYTREQTRSTRRLPTTEKRAPLSPADKNKHKTESPNKDATPKSSQNESAGTPPKRTTRARKTQPNNDNKRRASLVVTKKSPKMAPEHNPKLTKNKTPSPKPTRTVRSTRANKDKTIITPKKTRAKALNAKVIVSKPSPQVKPRRGNNNKQNVEETSNKNVQENTSNTRKTRTNKNISETKSIESPKRGRKTRANAINSKPKSAEKKDENPTEIVKTKRARKTTAIQPEQVETTVRATRGRKTKTVEVNITEQDDKARQNKIPEVKGKTTRRTVKIEPQVSIEIEKKTRTRRKIESKRTGDAAQESQPISKRQKVESQESVQSEPTTRSRTTKVDTIVNNTAFETKTRKRKTTTVDDVPRKLAKTEVEQKAPLRKGNKNVSAQDKKQAKTDVEQKSSLRQRKGNENVSLAEANRTVRSSRRQKAEVVSSPQLVTRPVRGRKAVAFKENSQVNKGRQRNTSETIGVKSPRAGRSRRR